MGCGTSKGTRIMNYKRSSEHLKAFTIKIEDPKTAEEEKQYLCFSYQTENDELPIMQIMNGIAFDEGEKGNKFDANFLSLYNEKKLEFEYFVQRLMGQGMENENEPL